MLVQELRHAVRSLRRVPAFTTTVIVTLALGIGATSGVFSIINGLLLRELPVKDPHRLGTISSEIAMGQGRLAGDGWSYAMWERFRDGAAQAFDGAFVWMPRRLNLAAAGEMQLADGLLTTSDFFTTLGVRAALGRTFTADDDRRGGGPDGPVTVVSHAFWQRELAGGPNAIGSPLFIEGVPFTIVGVTPPGFVGVEVGRSFDVALTFGAEPLIRRGAAIDEPRGLGLIPIVRLKPTQTAEAGTAALRVLQRQVLGPSPPPRFLQEPFVFVPAPTGTSAAEPGMWGLRQRYERSLFILFAIVALLLLIACANIANLHRLRATGRRRELSIRLALGASRLRLAGQLLVETLVLGVAGVLGGLVLSQWTTKAFIGQMSTVDTRISLDLPFDWRALGFTTLVTTVTLLLVGVAPALSTARRTQVDPMQADARTGRRDAWCGPSHGLVVAQVALSLVLLVAAGLFVRTLAHLAGVPLGFDRDAVLLVTVETKRASIGAEARLPFYERLVAAVSAVPNVEHVAASTLVPLTGGLARLDVRTPQMPDADWITLFSFVSADWFATYGTRLAEGRDFDARDSGNAPPVAIINEAFARMAFPGGHPIGHQLLSHAPNWRPRTVVGVVGDSVSHSLGATARAGSALRERGVPMMYLPLAQAAGLTPPDMSRITIGVRPTAGSPSRLAARVGASLTSVDPNVTFSIRPLDDVVRVAYAQERQVAILSGVFGALALLLAAIGLYGVSSFAVSQRRAEIGVRMALGAERRSVVRLMLRRVAIVTGLGIAEGLVLSLWGLQIVSSLLYGLSPDDPATLLGAILTLAGVGLAAGWIPAWRATCIEPIEVLREM